jgi:hypothetical protein
MPVCPSCNKPTSDPKAPFCAYCGFALPAGSESFPAFAAHGPPSATDTAARQLRPGPAWSSEANPRVVAVGLGALASAVVLAIALSYGSGSTAGGDGTRAAAAPSPQRSAPKTQIAAAANQPLGLLRRTASTTAGAHPRPLAHLRRYRASGYSFAYPSGWQVSRGDQPITSYRETVLESANGGAKVNVDYSPGGSTDPASMASQVEAATRNTTPGYRRISFGATTVNGHAAFAWDFVVPDADPRRADLFVRAPGGDFALLAYGPDLARARSAASFIAGSLSGAL